jgi:hypothetical protein
MITYKNHSDTFDLWTLFIVRNSKYLVSTTFRKMHVFQSSGKGKGTPTLLSTSVQSARLALSKGPNRVGASLSSHEDGNSSSFRSVVLSSYLEFRKMDKARKLSDPKKPYKHKTYSVAFSP